MNFEELKEKVKIFLKGNNSKYTEKALEELRRAKIAYDDGFDFEAYLKELKEKEDLSNGYVIPYVLGLTSQIDIDMPVELRQVKTGDGGGLDIDSDISTEGKPRVKEYLEKKYGKDHICSVGTYTTIGLASAIKDILRKENVSFKDSNNFCSKLDVDETFDENMNRYKVDAPDLYHMYEKYKTKLDFVPKLCSMVRSSGKHAGGIMILDRPVYECLPVIRPQGELAVAFVENGADTELDSLGYVKYDILGISTLDIINEAVDMINEKLYRIIDDDGIEKIVGESYLKNTQTKDSASS